MARNFKLVFDLSDVLAVKKRILIVFNITFGRDNF